jgi:uncharacterized protein
VSLPEPSATSAALVTGASAGIGTEIARELAARGHGLVLVARRRPRLDELAKELSDEFGIRAEALGCDLAKAAARNRLPGRVESLGLDVEILVNNAGFGIYEPLARSDRQRELRQVRLLVEAVVDLDARYVPAMVERGRGAVINLSSTAGFQPLPGNGTYSAAKSFVLVHTEALHEELRETGVTATAVAPGPVRSEFQEISAPLFADRLPKIVWCDPAQVAADALRAVERGKRSVVPGGVVVKASFAPNRLMPTSVTAVVTRRLMAGELKRAD